MKSSLPTPFYRYPPASTLLWTTTLTVLSSLLLLPSSVLCASLPPGVSSTASSSSSSATKPPTSTSSSGGGPKISITAHDGSLINPNGPSPIITWSTKGKSKNGEYDYELGLDVQVRTAQDLNALPKTVWGKIATRLGGGGGAASIEGDEDGNSGTGGGGYGIIDRLMDKATSTSWDVSARADMDVTALPERKNIDLDVRADCHEEDLSLKLFATSAQDQPVSLRRIDFSKGFKALRGKIFVNPRYDLPTSSGDIVLTYDRDDDNIVQLYAAPHNQKLTIARKVAEGHVVAPTITSAGGFSVQWRHSYDGNSVVTTLVPKENINVRWTDGAWTCDFDAPIEGTKVEGMKVSVRRKMEFQ